MTIPIERTWAVQRTYQFLKELCDPKATPNVPLAIRKRALGLIRHYPTDFYLEQSQKKTPEIWGTRQEFKAKAKIKPKGEE